MNIKIRQPESYQRLIDYLHSQLDENKEVRISHRQLGAELGLGKSSIILLVSQLKRLGSDDWEVISGGWKDGLALPTMTVYRYLGNN